VHTRLTNAFRRIAGPSEPTGDADGPVSLSSPPRRRRSPPGRGMRTGAAETLNREPEPLTGRHRSVKFDITVRDGFRALPLALWTKRRAS